MTSTKYDEVEVEDEDIESFAVLNYDSLEGYITPPKSTSTSASTSMSALLSSSLSQKVLSDLQKKTDPVKLEQEQGPEQKETTIINQSAKANLNSESESEIVVGTKAEANKVKVSSISVGTDKEVDEVSLELKRVTKENVELKRELEALNMKLNVEKSKEEETLDKIKKELDENVKSLQDSCLLVEKLTKENEALKVQIETTKLRMTELESHLETTCEELAARKRDDDKYMKIEKVEIQLRFKDDQLAQAKKQLKELDELYQGEQNQTIELKEKLRIAESQPISLQGDGQLMSFHIEDIISLQQELTDSKAMLEGQNKEVEKMRLELDRQQKILVETDKERTFLAQITMLLGGLLAISLFWISRSSHTQD